MKNVISDAMPQKIEQEDQFLKHLIKTSGKVDQLVVSWNKFMDS